ncbi:MAG: hypothetical protein Q9218_002523 [Villophora microphyllina]
MHVQLRRLRDAIPRLVDPMLVPHSSPERLYANYAQNVATTRLGAKGFSSLYHEDGTRELFKKAEESRANNTEPIRGWRVAEHEDWLDVHNVDIPSDVQKDGTLDPDSRPSQNVTTESLRAALERFKEAHSDMEGSFDEGSQTVKVFDQYRSNRIASKRAVIDHPTRPRPHRIRCGNPAESSLKI